MDQTSRLSFLCDERVQRLSAQAESFLNRVREVFDRYPMALDEHGRAPADPAQLRNLTYPHRPDIRHTYVARWFAEIEAAFLVTVAETEAQGRWFELVDAGQSLPRNVPLALLKPGDARVINNSGSDPPKTDKKIAAVAATAFSVSDFIARARELDFYQGFDLEKEWNEYVDHRRKLGRPSTLENFVQTWMVRAQRRFGKIKPKPRPSPMPEIDPLPLEPIQDEPDLFDMANHRLFMERFERSKARRAQ
jgi:hypothetical protein